MRRVCVFRRWCQLARPTSLGLDAEVRVVAFSYEALQIYGRMEEIWRSGSGGVGSKLWSMHCQMVDACIGEESGGNGGEGKERTLVWNKRPSFPGRG